MKAYIQFLGHSSPEGPPTIMVHYDSQRYMFNCREGTQRLCVEEKLKWSKLKNIYLTRVTWDCVGGLPGMLLTVADGGVKDLTLHGPKNLTHFMASTRHFIYRTSLSVKTEEYGEASPPKHKGPLTVTPVVVLPDNYMNPGIKRRRSDKDDIAMTTEEEDLAARRDILNRMFDISENKTKTPAPAHTIEAACSPRNNPDEIVMEDIEEPAPPVQRPQRPTEHLRARLPSTCEYPAAVTYICRGPTLPGKFKKDVAMALGIPPGPVYGRLQRGETVTLDDGRVIEPSQVMDPSLPGHLFMVVDCPNVRYLDNLISSPEFAQYQTTNQPGAMIHMIGQDVLDNPRYRAWMNSFGPETQHVISTTDICAQSVLYESHAFGQFKLSHLDREIFPVPKYSNTPRKKLEDYTDLPPKTFPFTSMGQLSLEPRTGVDTASLQRPVFDHTKSRVTDWIRKNTEIADAITKAKKEAATVDMSEKFAGENVQVITLGTGSSIPSKYRNVSATMVKLPDNQGSIMLDAGEGTYGQMMRRFGEDKVDDELKNLRCIFVSHLHADHHLGVIHLLTKWWELNKGNNKRLYVVAPFIFKWWMDEYSCVQSFGLGKQVFTIRNESILTNKQPTGFELTIFEELKKALGMKEMQAVNVIHCRFAYGLNIEHDSGWKLVYSGDTRPCNNLIQAGKDATLLIHEATLEDGMMAEAIAKRHSTTKEAVSVGQRMNAKYTLLNHFSQRYPKLPLLSKEQQNVCFSFDMMSVAIKQIPMLPKFTDAIRLLFKEEEEEENDEVAASATERTRK
ncbi:hypothetical protein K492DRAFT_153101 [Lichtheimia hyalospora FSU 10163]|nr:hypothetical protein K492DRAFT_153101 [Lichtheimia hyalospora FSU 10163]